MNEPELQQNRAGLGWPTAAMWVCIVAILAGSGIYVFKSCIDAPAKITGAVADRVSKAARDFMSSFVQGTVSTEFREYCTEVSTNLSLQVATLKQVEQFTRTDEAVIGNIPLPEVVVRVTAPVDYTYFVDLDRNWDFTLKDNLLTVVVPDILFNRPSFDVSRMEWEVKKDSFFRRTKQVQEDLKNSLMPLAIQRGKIHAAQVKETGRAQVANFLQSWLKQHFIDGKNYQIKVVFQSELHGSVKRDAF